MTRAAKNVEGPGLSRERLLGAVVFVDGKLTADLVRALDHEQLHQPNTSRLLEGAALWFNPRNPLRELLQHWARTLQPRSAS